MVYLKSKRLGQN